MSSVWHSSEYQQTALIVLSFLFISGFIVYLFRKKNYYFVLSWASIKSWLIVAPILFVLLAMPPPWPLVVLTTIAIFGAKNFFQLMGMYHRSYFVLTAYTGIISLGMAAHYGRIDIYNLLPMIVFAATCLIPLVRNNYKFMIQYIALTNLAFVFLGWSFMHLGLIFNLEKGIYQLLYLVVLTEFCDNTTLAISRYVGKIKIFDRIDQKRTFEAFFLSSLITIFVAGAMRFLLPDTSNIYWWTSGIIASVGGFVGDMIMTVIRRDASIKVVGPFVLGRGDYLRRMDRLIFVAPIYYYTMLWLDKVGT